MDIVDLPFKDVDMLFTLSAKDGLFKLFSIVNDVCRMHQMC